MMSIEAQIEELYGDTKDDEWKKEEVARLKEEQGISSVEEPDFSVEEGIDGSPSIKPQLQNEPGGIQADA
jgi:phage minor capsid protein